MKDFIEIDLTNHLLTVSYRSFFHYHYQQWSNITEIKRISVLQHTPQKMNQITTCAVVLFLSFNVISQWKIMKSLKYLKFNRESTNKSFHWKSIALHILVTLQVKTNLVGTGNVFCSKPFFTKSKFLSDFYLIVREAFYLRERLFSFIVRAIVSRQN